MATKAKTKAKAKRPRRKKAQPSSRGLPPRDVATPSPAGEGLAALIREDGGEVIGQYRDPLGGHPVLLAALPVDKVEPTPYQRDLSEPHVKRLATAMERLDRFLDPVIAVRNVGDDGVGKYWTPNGNHRLHASKLLGARTVVALVLPDADVAYQILALNTEKAHNLKERSLEVIRMYRDLAAVRESNEADFAHLFEEPSFITLGAAYQKRPRFSAGAYQPFVKRLEAFFDEPLGEALELREARADRLLELDDAVNAVVGRLKERGLQSPYLKNFVVARVNFLRFHKGEPPDFDDAVTRMLGSVQRFNVDKVKREDIGRMGGGGGGEGDED
jgi:ParB family chromosome partitioning protein